MTQFKTYQRRVTSGELRPYVVGENLDGVSISDTDKAKGSPKEGDMIARNPENSADEWLVSKEYFEQNYVSDPT